MTSNNAIKTETWLPLVPERIASYEEKHNQIIVKVPNKPGILARWLFRWALKNHSNKYLHLDNLGSLVWSECDKSKSIADIITSLGKQFPEEPQMEYRVIIFIDQLVKQGAIQLLERIDD